jgi:hypothetical protein
MFEAVLVVLLSSCFAHLVLSHVQLCCGVSLPKPTLAQQMQACLSVGLKCSMLLTFSTECLRAKPMAL